MLQKLIAPLGTYGWNTAPIQVPLIRGVNIHEILIKVRAVVTITDPGAGVAGTINTEGVQRIVRGLRLRHDGIDRAIIDGRWAYRLFRASGLDYPIATNIASGAAQVGTVIECWLSIPFERPWNARPFDTLWSGRTPVAQELAVYIESETGSANAVAGTEAGTAALVQADNTMSVTWAAGGDPTYDVYQIYSTNAVQPLFVPHYAVRATDAFAAANTELAFSLLGLPRFDAVLFRDLYGTYVTPQDGINFFTFQVAGGATKYYGRTPWELMQLLERRGFPATSLAVDARVGESLVQFAEKGRLSSVVVPSTMNDPRFVFDVDAPTATTGRIHMLFCELHKLPGVTRENL